MRRLHRALRPSTPKAGKCWDGGLVVGAASLLVLAALDGVVGLGPSEMQCGFPAEFPGEPVIRMDIEPANTLNGIVGTLPVHLELTTGKNDMQMAAVAQPLGTASSPFVLIAGSPIVNIHFSLGLRGDGSASLTIRDSRRGHKNMTEVTRNGHCNDHERFFMMFDNI